MKKIFILMMTFCMLLSFNANAGTNADNFAPKTEIFSNKNSKKIKTIQKFLNTKIGKFIIKKTLKKLQKNQLKNDIKKKKNIRNNTRGIVILSFGALLLISGIILLFTGYTLLGIILGVLGLAIILTFVYIIWLIGNAFSQYKGF